MDSNFSFPLINYYKEEKKFVNCKFFIALVPLLQFYLENRIFFEIIIIKNSKVLKKLYFKEMQLITHYQTDTS